ncbi:MAG: hypothetical protein R3245_01225 [Kiloniellales bacterium]|nr:hypothetical protein [Kiloniellales bacterium]
MVGSLEGTLVSIASGRIASAASLRSQNQNPEGTVPSQPVNRPDAPKRQTSALLHAVREVAQLSANPQSATAGSDAGRAPATPLVSDSGLTTYRDKESGRLVIRVFDRESGDVLLEFPPENQRRAPTFFTSGVKTGGGVEV